MTLRTAHGSACEATGVVVAIAPVELKTIEPAIRAPITPRARVIAMCLLRRATGKSPR
jgi:hypothetical protein